MEDQIKKKSIETRLKSEKVEVPRLSDLNKERMTQKILNSSKAHGSLPSIKGQGLSYKYYLVAALLILSCVLLMIAQPKPEAPIISNPIVKVSPIVLNAESIAEMLQKLDPDQIGTYASLIVNLDTDVNLKYQTEFQALSLISNRIVSSFYEDFKPAKTLGNN